MRISSCPSVVPVAPSMISFIPSIFQLPPAHTHHSQSLPVALSVAPVTPSISMSVLQVLLPALIRGDGNVPLPSRGRVTPEPGVQGRTLPGPQGLSHLQDLLPLGLSLLRPQAQLGAKQRGWAGVIPQWGLHTPSAPSPNSLLGQQQLGQEPRGEGKGGDTGIGGSHTLWGGHTRTLRTPSHLLQQQEDEPRHGAPNPGTILGVGSGGSFGGLEGVTSALKPPPSPTDTPGSLKPPHSSWPGPSQMLLCKNHQTPSPSPLNLTQILSKPHSLARTTKTLHRLPQKPPKSPPSTTNGPKSHKSLPQFPQDPPNLLPGPTALTRRGWWTGASPARSSSGTSAGVWALWGHTPKWGDPGQELGQLEFLES
ncbi:uncharacterized protein LOC134562374 [Prinia subflava]|uniref:uncharacterized protein LOC134562374 n=1 Tax=Prinia subflava TaxID=208062 RepID=UPI002FE27432